MEPFQVDLTNCDKEPIHILGKVQSHGFLVAVDVDSGLITYISENISAFINEHARSLLGKTLEALGEKLNLNISGPQFLFNQLINTGFSSKSIESLNPYYIELAGMPYNVILVSSGNELIIEFEPFTTDEFDSQKIIGGSISKILSGSTLQSLLVNAAKEIKKIIKYDRVMVYKFSDDGHGQVVAEEKNEGLQPFLNLYYPASDIPKQARELYKLNLTRIIADVNSEPSSIFTNKTDGLPINLTHAEIRAVSPMHIQYLKNMGVQSSFSISLVSKGELWGLIACHNYTPKFINFNARSTSKLVGQILSSAIEFRQGEEDSDKFEVLGNASSQLISFIDNHSQIMDAVTTNNITIKDITTASGVVFIFDGKRTCIGVTPGDEQINEIVEWLLQNMRDAVYSTHSFPQIFKPAAKYSGVASGILACILSRELKEIIIWFKPELLQNIQWAGNPEKPVEVSSEGVNTLSPRKSFESWTETVRHTSAKWNRSEIAAVIKIREHLIYAIKRKANEIRLLNEKLVLAYDELDTFSYTVSHDLRTPLSSIKGYSELLLTSNESLDDNARRILERIRLCTDKMAMLITEILSYSKVGQAGIHNEEINVEKIIEEIQRDVTESLNNNVVFTIGNTPAIKGDKVMITQVFDNLINNAVKYSSTAEGGSKVNIGGETVGKEIVYSVTDNGIGIDINFYNKVFELFKRMDNVQDIDGTGVGLAIVKRIMEKHGGRVWFDSRLGLGTTFKIAFKNDR